jgi:flagellar biosynthesis/type III secretory pathway M-ring protein FliF/YscJ
MGGKHWNGGKDCGSFCQLVLFFTIGKAAARRAPSNCGENRSWRDADMAASANKDNQPAIKTAADAGAIDVNKVDAQVNASLARKVRILVERHPQAALTIIRHWMHETSYT